MKHYLLLAVVIPSFGFSQKMTIDRPDQFIEPDPYKEVYFNDLNTYKDVKSVEMIMKGKWNDFSPDTVSKAVFENGAKISEIKFRENIPNSSVIFQYNDDGSLNSWKQSGEQSSPLHVYYSYDSLLRINLVEQYYIKKNSLDSTVSATSAVTYTDGKLTEIAYNNDVKEIFNFSDGRLISKANGLAVKKFLYDNKGNLAKSIDYVGDLASNKVTGVKIFQWNEENQIVLDSTSTGTDFLNNVYQVTTYEYEGKALLSVNVTYKEFYRNIVFEYKNERIDKVHITTNRANSAYLRHWLHSKIGDEYQFPINSTESFEYDSHGNKTAKKIYVNEELFMEVDFVIGY